MVQIMKELNAQILFFIVLIGILFLVFRDWSSEEEKETRALVHLWADKLDRQVTDAGVYIKAESEKLPVTDAWGSSLKVIYQNEGIAEQLYVSSPGEVKIFDTKDDIQARRTQINMKGIGTGIKQNTAEVAAEATKGSTENIKEFSKEAAKGLIQGFKEELNSKP